jgi:hypothetical protein
LQSCPNPCYAVPTAYRGKKGASNEMLGFLAALALIAGSFFGFWAFMTWVLKEHLTAEKYRALVRSGRLATLDAPPLFVAPPSAAPKGPAWKITFKGDRGKTQTVVIEAETEGDALKKLIKEQSTSYGSIVSSEQV